MFGRFGFHFAFKQAPPVLDAVQPDDFRIKGRRGGMEFSKRIRGAATMQYPQDAAFAPLPHNVSGRDTDYIVPPSEDRPAEMKVC